MEYQIKLGQADKQKTDCVVVGVLSSKKLSKSAESLDKASKGYLSKIIKQGDIDGSFNQTAMLHHIPGIQSPRVLLVGCGKEESLNEERYRKLIKKVVSELNKSPASDAAIYLNNLSVKGRNQVWLTRDAVITTEQSLYQFDKLKSKPSKEKKALKKLYFMTNRQASVKALNTAVKQGLGIAAGVTLTRNLGNMPPNFCNPSYLAKEAQTLAKEHPKLSCKVLEETDMTRLKMGLLLSVTSGSKSKAKLIQFEYKGGKAKQAPVVLVGKGITFDTGGNSLKPAGAMIGMKFDMCGGATVFGVIKAAATLKLPLNIVGIIPACENMPGATATRPDDVVTSMSGKTVEILNTDAEGRLILADALTYAERFKPDCVIDIATLTGACIMALGYETSALMSNHDPLANELLHASQSAFDRAWQLPIWDTYAEVLKSNFADMANIGNMGKPAAGTIVAGCFLSKFTEKYNWAHLDIAGVACNWTGHTKGASGRPVPLLVEFLLNRC